ncbi:DUF6944 family repetitive protein [Thalassobacillus hwangdonensis]|uniref:DUF6944 family repetitive protein n=1 Tax=Thalassobacillus hwangdonensis TaxID=546108 RepID=A0ABW3L1A6_9BACI
MDQQLTGLTAAWVEAIGTIVAAVSSTPSRRITTQDQDNLSLAGNVLQATGSGLAVDGGSVLEDIGNGTQAIGNSTVIYGLLLTDSERERRPFTIKGNLLQALGGGVVLADGFDGTITQAQSLINTGNLMQVIGNSMQAIGASRSPNDPELGQTLGFLGSWIQAAGATLIAIVQTKQADSLNE